MKNQRNESVELLRIIACLIVIAMHISVRWVVDNHIIASRLFIRMLIKDGVPLFLMIMGYFLFTNGKSFHQLISKTYLGIIFPAFVIMLIIQIIAPWINNTTGLLHSIFLRDVDSVSLFQKLMQWRADIPLCLQYHYIYIYMGIILWFPILRLFAKQDKNITRIRRYMMAWTGLSILVMDYCAFFAIPDQPIFVFTIIPVNILQVMIGYEISLKRDRIINNRKATIIGIAVFFLCNILLTILQVIMFNGKYATGSVEFDDNIQEIGYFTGTGTMLCNLSSVALFIGIISISIHNEKAKQIIRFIASKTFYIYLIHWAVFTKLDNIGVRKDIFKMQKENSVGVLIYTILYTMLIFSISICIIIFGGIILKQVSILLYKILNKFNMNIMKYMIQICLMYMLLQLINTNYIVASIMASIIILLLYIIKTYEIGSLRDKLVFALIGTGWNTCFLVLLMHLLQLNSLIAYSIVLISDILIISVFHIKKINKFVKLMNI